MIRDVHVEVDQSRDLDPVYEGDVGRPVGYRDRGTTPFKLTATFSFRYSEGDEIAQQAFELLRQLHKKGFS